MSSASTVITTADQISWTNTKSFSMNDLDDATIVDSVAQLAFSNNWEKAVSRFIDENCATFTSAEEFHHVHHDVFMQFIQLKEELLEELMHALNLSEDRIFTALASDPAQGIVVAQFILMDSDFEEFSQMMHARNNALNGGNSIQTEHDTPAPNSPVPPTSAEVLQSPESKQSLQTGIHYTEAADDPSADEWKLEVNICR